MYIFWFKKNIDVVYVSPNKQQKISWKLIVRKARKKQTKHKREKQTAGKKAFFFGMRTFIFNSAYLSLSISVSFGSFIYVSRWSRQALLLWID